MVGLRVLVPPEAQCACQHGYSEMAQIPLQRGVLWASGNVGVADIHHHVLKSTTGETRIGLARTLHHGSWRNGKVVRDKREERDSRDV